jgi:hypothetical protein
MSSRDSSGKMCAPNGKGQQLCVAFSDYRIYKYTRPDLCWTEDHEVLIYPNCKQELIITEE